MTQGHAAPPEVHSSRVLDLAFTRPAQRVYLGPVTRRTVVQAGSGLVITLGPNTAVVTLFDQHGDDSSGWGGGTPCTKLAEVLVWRGPPAGEALAGLMNAARAAGWTVRPDLAPSFGKGQQVVEVMLVPYRRGARTTAVAVLCRQ